MADARQTMIEELHALNCQKKQAGSSLMIQCPFHDDIGPSCGVNLSTDNGMPLGMFNCFGCPAKGHWNMLAEKLGLSKFKDWELGFTGNGSTREEKRRQPEATMKTTNQVERMYKVLKTKEIIEWPLDQNWRGYDGKILRKLGALMFSEREEVMLFFPIYVNKKFVGGVKAHMEKPQKGLSYINTNGTWVKSNGLLGYDYVKQVCMKAEKNGKAFTSLVLVEGPRDVTRLLLNKIPALSILGIENFSLKKLMKVLAITGNLKTLYVMPDNDNAGKEMYKKIKEIAQPYIRVRCLKLPRERDKNKKLIKMDPDNAPQYIIDEVKSLIDSERVRRAA